MSQPPELGPRAVLTPELRVLLGLQLLSGILVAPMFSLFPVYVESQLGQPPGVTAAVRGLFVVLGGVVAFLSASIIRRTGVRTAYLLGMSGVVAAGGMFLSDMPPLLGGLTLFAGVCFGLGAVAGQSMLMDAVPSEGLGLATAWFFTAGTAGNALGNAVAGAAMRSIPGGSHAGFTVIGMVIVVGQLMLMVAAARCLPRACSNAGSSSQQPTDVTAVMRESTARWIMVLRMGPTLYWGAVTLLTPLLLFRLTHQASAAATYTAWNLAASGVCQILAGRWVDRHGVMPVLVIATVAVTISAVGGALMAHQVWALWLFGTIGACGAWSVSVAMSSLIHRFGTDQTRAGLIGLGHLAWSLGFLVGTGAAGWFAGRPGQEGIALAVGGAGGAAAVTAAMVLSRRPSTAAVEME